MGTLHLQRLPEIIKCDINARIFKCLHPFVIIKLIAPGVIQTSQTVCFFDDFPIFRSPLAKIPSRTVTSASCQLILQALSVKLFIKCMLSQWRSWKCILHSYTSCPLEWCERFGIKKEVLAVI